MLKLPSCREALALPSTQGAPPCLGHDGQTTISQQHLGKTRQTTQDLQDDQDDQEGQTIGLFQ